MKIADYNKLRISVFLEATKNQEIADALKYNDMCYLYDVVDAKQQHGVLVLTAKTQLNDNTLKENGFDAETARANLVLCLNRTTKCATFNPDR